MNVSYVDPYLSSFPTLDTLSDKTLSQANQKSSKNIIESFSVESAEDSYMSTEAFTSFFEKALNHLEINRLLEEQEQASTDSQAQSSAPQVSVPDDFEENFTEHMELNYTGKVYMAGDPRIGLYDAHYSYTSGFINVSDSYEEFKEFFETSKQEFSKTLDEFGIENGSEEFYDLPKNPELLSEIQKSFDSKMISLGYEKE